MKKCKWNIQRPVWAFLVILCCHGNFADDPLPSFTQLPDDLTPQQTQKTIPIGGLTDSTSRTDNIVRLASIESAGPAIPLPKVDASIFNEKNLVVTNSLNLHGTSVEIGSKDNVSLPPSDGKSEEGDQLASSSKSTDSNPDNRASQERSNPLFMAGLVLEAPLPAPVKDASSQIDIRAAADLPRQEETPLPVQASESEPEILPEVTEEGHKAKEEAVLAEQQSPDNEGNGELGKQHNVAELKSEVDSASPVRQQAQDPPQYPLDGSGTPVTEDMPSFSEWSKKRLEEQVKQGSNPPVAASQQNKAPPKQVRHKNYASVDCGAKVINANPEAQSTGSVLSHFRDDYMLNPCTAKIWFIIELCESIQADRIDLANFELFSSSPKEFSVYSSDRYPTRDWTFLGAFEATDERTVQNFSFGHTTFGKYIKVEMVSRYGSEHFCPLSLVRVFGTSEYEALETEDDSHDRSSVDEDDEVISDGEHLSSHESQNLFGSAKDVVMNIVKKVLRSEKSASESSGDEKVEQFSVPSENNSSSGSEKCVCLQRLPADHCDGGEEEGMSVAAGCPKEVAIMHLRCHYSELLMFLLRGWPGTFHGRLLEQCFSTCVPHIEECNSEPADFSALGRASSPVHPTCLFYSAILGPASFGALCHLDRLLLDEHSRQPSMVPRCHSGNRTSNVTAASLDLAHVPEVTPTALFETASSQVGILKSAAGSGNSYQCDSLDHIAVCSTKLVATAVGVLPPLGLETRASDSESVIHTGAIVAKKHVTEGSQSASSSSSFQSQILPTRTLPDDAKLPPKSRLVPNAKVPSIFVPASEDSASKQDESSGPSTEDRSIEPPPTESPDPGAAIAAPSEPKAAPTNREPRSSSAIPKSEDVPSGLDVKPDGANVPKDQSTNSVKEQPADLTAAVLPPPDANLGKEAPGSASQQGVDSDSDSAILEQEQAIYDEGSTVAPPIPQNGFATSGEGVVMAGGGNGRSLNGAGMVSPGQKESVFVRLSNRIKALELNMSLSSQYLEELSRRYRKQMEEMQKAFNKTIGALNETARSAYERDVKQQEVILNLQTQLDNMYKVVLNLQEEQDGIHATVVTRHILLMAAEACVMGALFMACVRSSQKPRVRSGRAVSVVHPNTSAASKRSPDEEGRKKHCSSPETAHRRRNSDSSAVGRHGAGTSNALDVRGWRRPSTEALNVSGSYADLMIVEPTIPVWTAGPPLKEQERSRKKKKHKNKQQQGKQELYRSLSNNVLLYGSNSQKPPPVPPNNPILRKNSGTGMSSAGLLFAAVGKSAAPSRVQDLNRNEKKLDENWHLAYGGRASATSSAPSLVNGGGTHYSFANLFSGYYGGCPPPEFPAKLPLHPHLQQNSDLKKSVLEKVCG